MTDPLEDLRALRDHLAQLHHDLLALQAQAPTLSPEALDQALTQLGQASATWLATHAVPRAPTPLVVCVCGTVILTCTDHQCTIVHPLTTVLACGTCTQTGGVPVWEEES